MAKQFAIRLGLIAFAAASIRGLLNGSEFEATVKTALLATAVFCSLGLVFGGLARRLVEETVDAELRARMASESEITNQNSEIVESA